VVRPTAEGGGVKVLAIGSQERAPSLPSVPTAIEAGVPSLQIDGLSGLFGPAKMPLDVRKRIGADVVEAMKDKVLLDRLTASGQTPAPGGAEDLERSVQQQVDQVDAVAKLLGVQKKN
jgi:tripartite-type tricarboxylate transporter receptor subunit TctC